MKKGQKIEVPYFGLDFNYLGVSPFDKTKVEFSIEKPFLPTDYYPIFYKTFEDIVKSYGGDKFDYDSYPAKIVFELPKKGADDYITTINENFNILLGLNNFNNVFSSAENVKDASVVYFFWQFKIGLYKSKFSNAYILYFNNPIYDNTQLSETIAEFIRKKQFTLSLNSVQTKHLGNNESWVVFDFDSSVNLTKIALVDFIYWLKEKYETWSKKFQLGNTTQNLQPYFLLPKSDVQIYSIEKTPYFTFTPKNIFPLFNSKIEEFARKSLPLNDFPSFIKNQDNSFTFTMGNVSFSKQESYFEKLDDVLSNLISITQSSPTPQASSSTFPPKYFAVENDGSKDFKEFIAWFSKNYNSNYSGDAKWYGFDESQIERAVNDFERFMGNPQVFTAKEFMDNLKGVSQSSSTPQANTNTFPPKEFMVSRDNSSDFKDYIKFLNENYGTGYNINDKFDFYYYGVESYKGKYSVMVYNDYKDFINIPIFTAKEFMDNLRASQMPKQEEIITKTKKVVSSNDYTQQIDQLKKQIAEAMFLKSIISPIEFEKRIELEQSISKKQKEINELNFKTFEEKFEGSQVFDELFDQSFVEIQHDYQNIYSTNIEEEFADLFTPNGKPSVYSDEINELIRTPQFIEWFGDWELAYQYKDVQGLKFDCSKVLNENYEPLIVWHGTGGEFSYFKYDTFPASYFAVNKDYAKWFANLHGGDEGYVLPFFLNVKNPLDLTHFGTREVSTKDFFDYMYLQTGLDMEGLEINPIFADSSFRPVETWVYLRNNPKMLKKISELQIFDGIHFYETNPSVPTGENAHETEVWITFRPDQAKLADPSRGTILMASLKSFILKRGGKI
jgi:hypothetical protein